MQLSFITCHFVLMIVAASVTVASAVVTSADVDLDLGGACGFAVLAKSGISTVPTSAITGDIGVSPIDAAAIVGFSLLDGVSSVLNGLGGSRGLLLGGVLNGVGSVLDGVGDLVDGVVDEVVDVVDEVTATLQFSTSAQVNGNCVAAGYGGPISVSLAASVSAMEAAYTTGNNVPNDYTDITFNGAAVGTIGTATLFPGKYKFNAVITITEDITLDAQDDPNAIFIIQTIGGLDLAESKKVILANGAKADNIYWNVAGVTSLQADSHMEGNILCFTNISMFARAALNGRALSQTAVTLIKNIITKPEGCGEPVDDPDLFCA
jgi:hypothetical protein